MEFTPWSARGTTLKFQFEPAWGPEKNQHARLERGVRKKKGKNQPFYSAGNATETGRQKVASFLQEKRGAVTAKQQVSF